MAASASERISGPSDQSRRIVPKEKSGLQRGEDVLAGDALGGGNFAEDRVEGTDAQRLVVRHGECGDAAAFPSAK